MCVCKVKGWATVCVAECVQCVCVCVSVCVCVHNIFIHTHAERERERERERYLSMYIQCVYTHR